MKWERDFLLLSLFQPVFTSSTYVHILLPFWNVNTFPLWPNVSFSLLTLFFFLVPSNLKLLHVLFNCLLPMSYRLNHDTSQIFYCAPVYNTYVKVTVLHTVCFAFCLKQHPVWLNCGSRLQHLQKCCLLTQTWPFFWECTAICSHFHASGWVILTQKPPVTHFPLVLWPFKHGLHGMACKGSAPLWQCFRVIVCHFSCP